jgi:hypothetical protein
VSVEQFLMVWLSGFIMGVIIMGSASFLFAGKRP